VRVALAQLESSVGDKAKNLKKLEKAVASAQAELLLVGELFLSGYMARDAFARLARRIRSASSTRPSS
jgi:predicted amidohydrolase